jgi:predicted aldo/keto reductase-like oxidoreductase
MEYITLGKTGLKVSRLGFGGIPIQRVDAETTRTLIKDMVDKGINYIDTARGYTVSEEYLGEALEGYRDKFILATKSMARTKEAMAADIDLSLKKLRTDYIDIYQIHNATPKDIELVTAPGGALEALLEAKAAGKIGHIGMTGHLVEAFEKAIELDWVETYMFPYNIVEKQAEHLIHECTKRNIGFINMKPLAGGAIDQADIAIRYCFANPDVTIVIPGMYDLKEIEMNLKAAENTAPLSEEELTRIQGVRDLLGSNFCRRCNYCQPCTAGINISGILLFQSYYERYGLKDWAKERYATLTAKASDCIECGVCETRCPYNLPIRSMLKEASKNFDN